VTYELVLSEDDVDTARLLVEFRTAQGLDVPASLLRIAGARAEETADQSDLEYDGQVPLQQMTKALCKAARELNRTSYRVATLSPAKDGSTTLVLTNLETFSGDGLSQRARTRRQKFGLRVKNQTLIQHLAPEAVLVNGGVKVSSRHNSKLQKKRRRLSLRK